LSHQVCFCSEKDQWWRNNQLENNVQNYIQIVSIPTSPGAEVFSCVG
jgi:hypothetical protein